MNRRFLHSGRYGDLIYSLWTIKALGGGSLVFNLTLGTLVTDQDVKFCTPLLETLPYISDVQTIKLRKEMENTRGEKLFCRQDIDNPDLLILDNAWYWRHYQETYHWIYRYAYSFGVQVDASEAVIEIPIEHHLYPNIRPIVVHQTDRYRGSKIPEEFLEQDNVFIINDGSCKDMLQMAKLISKSKFFVGNQSIGCSLAQAMQHPRLIETPTNPFWYDAYPIGKYGFSYSSDFYSKLEFVDKMSDEYWREKKSV